MIRWVLLFVVLVIFASGAVAFYTVFFRPTDQIVIPPLREHSVVDAVATAERMGFAVKVEQVSSSMPEGWVLAQSPEPGTKARKKQLVVLQVSRGGEMRAVPDLRGQPLARAQSVLRSQGFDLGDIIRIRDSSQPGGVVIAQSPSAPANIPANRRIDLLISEGGGGLDGSVMIPDVARMSEKEASEILAASGLRVRAVDRIYSPSMSEGMAIETRPAAGTTVRYGDGVRLKIATLQKPEGYVEPKQAETSPEGQEGFVSEDRGRGVVVRVPGHGDVFVGDGTAAENTPIREARLNVSVFDQEKGVRVIRNPVLSQDASGRSGPVLTEPAPRPQEASESRPEVKETEAGPGKKTAKIRYQVPPLARPLDIRIEVVDPLGKRDVLSRKAKSGENIAVEVPYSKECVVSVYLGGEFVWQDRYR